MTTPTPKRVREATVTDRPILFSGPMIRAILDGQKTQTRRVVKNQPADAEGCEGQVAGPVCLDMEPWTHFFRWLLPSGISAGFLCPYGQPGDRLWVRETWGLHGRGDYTWWCRDSIKGRTADDLLCSYELAYAADATSEYDHWRPSIHMPRWASRLTLEVTSVRVERLQDITEDDARAEGAAAEPSEALADSPVGLSAREAFADLWSSINGSESWASNPWVWVVNFKRVEVRHG